MSIMVNPDKFPIFEENKEKRYDHIKSIEHSDFLDRPAKNKINYTEIVKFPCPHCGKEAEADISIVLSSYPGQYNYYCPHCGAYGSVLCSEVDGYRFKQNVWETITSPLLFGIKCIICGEESSFEGNPVTPYVCPKCKKAVMKMRRLIEEDND